MFALFLFCIGFIFINGQLIPVLTETDHFYLIDSKLSNSEAQNFCKDTFGTTLGSVQNDLYNSELRVIFTRFNYINNIWIDNTEDENYNNWGIKSSDNKLDCIVAKSLLGNWYINDCNSKEYFICNKFDSKENSDIISRLTRRRLVYYAPTGNPSYFPTPNPTRSPLMAGDTHSPTRSPIPLTEIYPIAVSLETTPIFMFNGASCGAKNAISTLATSCPFGWDVDAQSNGPNGKYAIYEFENSEALKRFGIQNFGNNATDVRDFDLGAFNDETGDVTAILSGTTRPEDNTTQIFDISNTNSFKYWRIDITDTWGNDDTRVHNFKFYQ